MNFTLHINIKKGKGKQFICKKNIAVKQKANWILNPISGLNQSGDPKNGKIKCIGIAIPVNVRKANKKIKKLCKFQNTSYNETQVPWNSSCINLDHFIER